MTFKYLARWVTWHVFFGSMLYLGVYHNVAGAQNIVIFVVWMLLVGAVSLQTKDMQNWLRTRGRIAPQSAEDIFNVVVLGVLIWHSWWWTSVAFFTQVLLTLVAWKEIEKVTEKK